MCFVTNDGFIIHDNKEFVKRESENKHIPEVIFVKLVFWIFKKDIVMHKKQVNLKLFSKTTFLFIQKCGFVLTLGIKIVIIKENAF